MAPLFQRGSQFNAPKSDEVMIRVSPDIMDPSFCKGIFRPEDFQKPVDQLTNIKGRFLFSINDVPEIREIFKGFEIEEVNLNYTASSQGQKKAKELVIGN